jgi:hypothetical protein
VKTHIIFLILLVTPLLSIAQDVILHCVHEGESLTDTRTEMIVFQTPDEYRYSFTQSPVGYTSFGPIMNSFFNGNPTQNFKNNSISIFRLFGNDRGFQDHICDFSFTFKQEECR